MVMSTGGLRGSAFLDESGVFLDGSAFDSREWDSFHLFDGLNGTTIIFGIHVSLGGVSNRPA